MGASERVLPGRYLPVSKSVPVFDKPIDEKKLLEQVRSAIGQTLGPEEDGPQIWRS